MPLSLAEQNAIYTICRITGKDEVRSRLRALGIVEREKNAIRQAVAGNLIVEVKGIRFALCQSLARRIQV